MSQEADRLRADRGELVQALKDAGGVFTRENVVRCPFHDDQHASGSVYEKDGVWRFKCHGCGWCGDVIDVRAKASNRKPEDLLRELHQGDVRPRRPQPTIFETVEDLKVIANVKQVYVYTNPETRRPDMIVLRIEEGDGKRFLQARPEGSGFVLQGPPKPWPIYNRTRLATAQRVLVVEGEKCVHALAEIGIVATTSPGGAGKAKLADWCLLAGKTCFLWPDFDRPDSKGVRKGEQHMKDVAEELLKLDPAPRVFWLDPDILGLKDEGEDVVEYLEDYGGETTEDQVRAIEAALSLAEPLGGSVDLRDLIEDTIAGKRRAIAFPYPVLSRLSRALVPGTVTCICGDPGSGKSLLVLECLHWWQQNGVKLAAFELEEDRAYHLQRALAQLDNRSDLADGEWIRANPAEARAALERHQALLDALAPRISAAPDEQVKHRDLLAWIQRKAEEGCRIIIIDPVTAAATSDRPWQDDLNFLIAAKKIIREHGCSLVLVTHPRKGTARSGNRHALDDLAGGAAYPRFAQSVLWLVRPAQRKDVRCLGPIGAFSVSVNRILRIGKSRNGAGTGADLGFIFDGATLRFNEQGVILKPHGDPDQKTAAAEKDEAI